MRSSLYAGEVRHVRLTPRERAFRYGMRLFCLDLDELPRRELSPQVRTLADVGERQLAVELHHRESGLAIDDAQVAVEAYMRGDLPTGTSLTIRRSA